MQNSFSLLNNAPRFFGATFLAASFFVFAWWVSPNLSSIEAHRIDPDKIETFAGRDDIRLRRPTVHEAVRPLTEQYKWSGWNQRQFSYSFDELQHPHDLYIIYTPAMGGHSAVYLNGIRVGGSVRDDISGFGGNSRSATGIPPVSAHLSGPNRIDVASRGDDAAFGLRALYFGPREEIRAVIARHNYWANTIQAFSLIIAAFGGFAAAAFLGSDALRSRAISLSAVSYVVTAQAISRLPSIGDILGGFTLGAEAILLIVLAFTLTVLTGVWTQQLSRLNLQQRQGGLGLFVASVLTMLMPGQITGLKAALPLVLLAPILLTAVFWAFKHVGTGKIWSAVEAGLLLIALASVSYGLVHQAFAAQGSLSFVKATIAHLGSLPLILYFFGKLAVTAIAQVRKNRDGLLAALDANRTELGLKTEALAEETRQRILLEERDRLTRDVHDGIGGQLLSLLVRVRSGTIEQYEIEQELQDGLTDLRLIVDSLDSGEEGFSTAMHSFRARIIPQLHAAEIALEWEANSANLESVQLGTRSVLNVYRFLQEAVANVVRHAKASLICISIERNLEDNSLIISVEDNGVGLSETCISSTSGKGVRNMRKRAAKLDGAFDVGSSKFGHGVCCKLTIPLETWQESNQRSQHVPSR